MKRPRFTALALLIVLLLLASVPLWLLYRQVRQSHLDQALIAAIRRNDASAVTSLLAQGADPNAHDHAGKTLTIYQALRHLFHRADRSNEGPTALAVAFGADEANPAIISALIAQEGKAEIHDVGLVGQQQNKGADRHET